jgi:deazaflavin-dependent oxidoreductase (nitroreductase family)
MYLPVGGESVAVFATKAGAPTNPHWYHNLLANPRVRAEIGTQTADFTARVAEGDERERLWTEQKRVNPGFAGYEEKTTRQIPVVILEPANA